MENQVRKGSNGKCSSVPVRNSRRVYKSNHDTKVKFLPVDEVIKLASKTPKKRNSRQNSSKPGPTLMKKVHTKTSVSTNQSESGTLLKEPNAVVHIKAPSCSVISVEGPSSNTSMLSLYMKAKSLNVDVASMFDQSSTSELIKDKGYETSSVLKSCILEEGPGDAESQENNSSSVSNGPAAQRIWKGNFEILDLPCELHRCEGFTAHCAVSICTKAHAFLKNIEEEVLFHSHPRIDFWLNIFKADGPDVLDISVYFYPGDSERSRREYASLLKYIEQEDLMLRYVMHHVELLVYPSKVLPLDSQKIGGSYFLWGVVRCSR